MDDLKRKEQEREWVRNSIATLEAGREPDVAAGLAKLRGRAAHSPRMWPTRLLRFAGGVALLFISTVVVLGVGSILWAKRDHSTPKYVFEADQKWFRQTENGERTGNREIRIRTDGAHVLTSVRHFPFLGTTALGARAVIWPDGTVDSYFDPLPIAIWHGRMDSYEQQVASRCNLDHAGRILGTEVIHGYKAVVVERTTSTSYRVTSWLVPALGCEALQTREETVGIDGSRRIVAAMHTVAVRTNP